VTFSPDVVAAVLHHMNDDHRDDSLLIARAFGDVDATAATMTTLDADGGTWVYTAGDAEHDLTVPWSTRLTERPQIRLEVVRLYEQACERLGLEPRPH
jgi:hypothetical protein